MADGYCTNCGHALTQGDRFCAGCSKAVHPPAQESVQESSHAVGMPDRQELTGVEFREVRKSLPWEPKYYEVYYVGEKVGEVTKAPFGGTWHFDGSRESYRDRNDAAYALIHGEAPAVETISAPPSQAAPPATQAPPGEGMRRAGSTMMTIGCLGTLLITIPIVLLVLFLLVLQCQLRHAASSAERLDYPRPEPFFEPLAVPTVERAVWSELLFWEVSP